MSKRTFKVIIQNFNDYGRENDYTWIEFEERCDKLIRNGYRPHGEAIMKRDKDGDYLSIIQMFWIDPLERPEILL